MVIKTTVETWAKRLARMLDPYSFGLFDRRRRELDAATMLVRERDDIIEQLRENNNNINSDLISHKLKILELQEPIVTPIDAFYGALFQEVPNITYRNKRRIDSEWMPVKLNSMITPDSYWAIKLNKKTKATVFYSRAKYIASYIARNTRWFDEVPEYKHKDRYLFIDETLGPMSQRCDCDDVSIAMVSCMPERCGWVFGIYHNYKEGNTYGHCWVEFVDGKGECWIIEQTGRDCEIVSGDDDRYEPIFCVTKDKTYRRSNKKIAFGYKH